MADSLAHVDTQAFARDLDALRAEAVREIGHGDLEHLLRMERWGRTAMALGYATAWVAPNPVSAILLGLGNVARWTIVTHHVLHKGYDRVPGAPARLTSRGFAAGRRRFVDWFDWFHPEAWCLEHNQLHHYHTSDPLDPDLVEENARAIRDATWPLAFKYVAVGFYALTWKFTYYAPNSFQVLRRAARYREQGVTPSPARIATGEDSYLAAWDVRTTCGRAFWRACVLPYGLGRFVLIPALFAPLGPLAIFNVWVNSVGAELVANLHSFLVIATNHVGDDVWRFEGSPRNRGEFYLRQVAGSVNFRTGGDVRDFFHGFLNYQIEHHLWPDLPARAYQRLQPKVKTVCERHGVPYLQVPLWKRIAQLVDTMVGRRSMKRAPHQEVGSRGPSTCVPFDMQVPNSGNEARQFARPAQPSQVLGNT